MEIVGVGGEETGDWESVTYALISHLGDDSVQLKLKAANTSYAVDKTLQLAGWKFDPDKESPIGSLGIVPLGGKVLPVVDAVVAASASEKAGVQAGDRIKRVGEQEITSGPSLSTRCSSRPGSRLR